MAEEMEMICFEIISKVGLARSNYMQVVSNVRREITEGNQELWEEADQSFLEARKVHAQLIQQEASGNTVTVNLLLVHAEDLMMSAETFKVLCEDIIELYRRTNELNKLL